MFDELLLLLWVRHWLIAIVEGPMKSKIPAPAERLYVLQLRSSCKGLRIGVQSGLIPSLFLLLPDHPADSSASGSAPFLFAE